MTRDSRPEGRPSTGPGENRSQEVYAEVVPLWGTGRPAAVVGLCTGCGGRIFEDNVTGRHPGCGFAPDVRATDPRTSQDAARGARRGRHSLVINDLYRHGPSTDDEIAARMPDRHPGSIAKARLAARRVGLVFPTGRTRVTRWGRDATVWEVHL